MISLSAIVAGAIAYFPHVLRLAEQPSVPSTAPVASLPVGALTPAAKLAEAAPAPATPTRSVAKAKPAATDVAAANRKLADAMAGAQSSNGLSQITRVAGGPSSSSTLGHPDSAMNALAFAQPGAPGDAAEATADLISRARAQLRDGAASSARLLLTRAARGGSPEALTLLGESYDAAALSELGAKGVRPDHSEARKYYRQGAAAGSALARKRLANLGA